MYLPDPKYSGPRMLGYFAKIADLCPFNYNVHQNVFLRKLLFQIMQTELKSSFLHFINVYVSASEDLYIGPRFP